ncbi:hypothetical protein [Frigoriflavimonas asaccharolytica]|uniref:TonB-like protein n=1 Tax=Frigoriflavimonas asaccharolytica TaxID=2735899 RepID=A0A8J8GB82_9FLAO|nr:hypothetical protein [Frigoriflavimonas asaccharolytica]NRS92482.1 hypothetical protein [Frigoriflavimonas asaccharolytica]
MKNKQLLFLILFTFILIQCKSQNFGLSISTIKKIESIYTKDDEIYLTKLKTESKKLADSCEKNKLNCFFDPFEKAPTFAGGINKFRELVYKNIDQTKIKKSSKARIKFSVEKNDKIADISVNSDDKDLRKEIFRVMNLDEIKNKYWQSGKISNRKVLYLFEFELEFNDKK